MQQYRTRRRQTIYKQFGGKCIKCGSTERLEFDHVDPTTKIASISRMWTASSERLQAELAKCQLLCYDCHRQKTALNGDASYKHKPWQHGVSGYINHKCRCDVCINAYRIYRKQRWASEKR